MSKVARMRFGRSSKRLRGVASARARHAERRGISHIRARGLDTGHGA